MFLWSLAPNLEKVILSNKVVIMQHPSLTCDSSVASMGSQGLLNSDFLLSEKTETSPHHCTGYPGVMETLSDNFGSSLEEYMNILW